MPKRLIFVSSAVMDDGSRQIFRVEQLAEDPTAKHELIEIEEPEFREGFYTSLKWDNEAKKFVYEEIEIPKSREQLIEDELNTLRRKNAELEETNKSLSEQIPIMTQAMKDALEKTEMLENSLVEFLSSSGIPVPPEEEGQGPSDTSGMVQGDITDVAPADPMTEPIGTPPEGQNSSDSQPESEEGKKEQQEEPPKREVDLTPDEKKELSGSKNITDDQFLDMVEENKKSQEEADGGDGSQESASPGEQEPAPSPPSEGSSEEGTTAQEDK